MPYLFQFILLAVCIVASGAYASCLEEIIELVKRGGLETSVIEFARFHEKQSRYTDSDPAADALLKDTYDATLVKLQKALGPSMVSLEKLLEVAGELSKKVSIPVVEKEVTPEPEIQETQEVVRDDHWFHFQSGNSPNALKAKIPVRENYETSEIGNLLIEEGHFNVNPAWGPNGYVVFGSSYTQRSNSPRNFIEIHQVGDNGISLVKKQKIEGSLIASPTWLSKHQVVAVDNLGSIHSYNFSAETSLLMEDDHIPARLPVNLWSGRRFINANQKGVFAVPMSDKIAFFKSNENTGKISSAGEFPMTNISEGVSWNSDGVAMVNDTRGHVTFLEEDVEGERWKKVDQLSLGGTLDGIPIPGPDNQVAVASKNQFFVLKKQESGKWAIHAKKEEIPRLGDIFWLNENTVGGGSYLREEFAAFEVKPDRQIDYFPSKVSSLQSNGSLLFPGPFPFSFGTNWLETYLLKYDPKKHEFHRVMTLPENSPFSVFWGDEGRFGLRGNSEIKFFQIQ